MQFGGFSIVGTNELSKFVKNANKIMIYFYRIFFY